jgi:hypothetical protein
MFAYEIQSQKLEISTYLADNSIPKEHHFWITALLQRAGRDQRNKSPKRPKLHIEKYWVV